MRDPIDRIPEWALWVFAVAAVLAVLVTFWLVDW